MALTSQERTDIIKLTVMMFNSALGANYLTDLTRSFEANGRDLAKLAVELAASNLFRSINPPTQTPENFAATLLIPLGLQGNAIAFEFVLAKVRAGVDKGHEWLKELLIGAGGEMSPREEGIVREYLTRLLSSPYGKALGAYAVGEGLTFAAPHLGARGPLAAAAGQEFRNRATTVAAKSAAGDLFALLPKGVGLVNELLNGFGDSLTPEAKTPAALSPGASAPAAFTQEAEAELTIPR